MSLDVDLLTKNLVHRKRSGIFIREHGQTKEITREEWDERNPGHEPCIVAQCEETCTAYSDNITHNLNRMAEEAGIYRHLWCPDEIGLSKASQLIEPLRDGLAKLKADPDKFKAFNPANGWGNYEVLVQFVENYLAACSEHPNADVEVSR